MRLTPLVLITILAPAIAWADTPVVEGVTATKNGSSWRFDVTLAHPDTGWDHYADGWEVLLPDGTQVGYRKLLHPHENEQPFTRSLSGITIPDDITSVTVRGHDSVHDHIVFLSRR